jgi:hypothetical protein
MPSSATLNMCSNNHAKFCNMGILNHAIICSNNYANPAPYQDRQHGCHVHYWLRGVNSEKSLLDRHNY